MPVRILLKFSSISRTNIFFKTPTNDLVHLKLEKQKMPFVKMKKNATWILPLLTKQKQH